VSRYLLAEGKPNPISKWSMGRLVQCVGQVRSNGERRGYSSHIHKDDINQALIDANNALSSKAGVVNIEGWA
jgi:hypothetical protein